MELNLEPTELSQQPTEPMEPATGSSVTHVFNQYYLELLKRIKSASKKAKDTNEKDGNAKAILREIKKSYASFDRLSEEYRDFFMNQSTPLMELIDRITTVEDLDDWYQQDTMKQMALYKDIHIEQIVKLFGVKERNHMLLYFLLLLGVFGNRDLNEKDVSVILEIFKKTAKGAQLSDIENDRARKCVTMLIDIQKNLETANTAGMDAATSPLLKQLENTSLGKLAKEIMGEIDLTEIQKSMGGAADGSGEPDIWKSLANPDGGFTKLLGTVSQKMISKMASGELQQEALLQDAMKIATGLGGGLGGMGGGVGNMMSTMSKMFGGNMDLSDLLSQMGMSGPAAAQARGARPMVNQGAVNRAVRAKQMRRKLDQRRNKEKENSE